MGGIETASDFIQGGDPIEAALLAHESLGLFDVGKVNETIIMAAIRQSKFVHGSSEPFADVEANLDGEREPRLNTGVHKTKDGIDHVVVETESFARPGDQFQTFGVSVTVDLKAGAGFNTAEPRAAKPQSNTSLLVIFTTKSRRARRKTLYLCVLMLSFVSFVSSW